MEWLVTIVVRLIRAGKRAYTRKWSFLAVFAFVFLAGTIGLAKLDLLPEAPRAMSVSTQPAAVALAPLSAGPELPTEITIPAIGLSATIANPTTTNVDVLDADLLKGAVRYPTSAELGEQGNVVLFGHSSYLPIVGNQAYKTFDGIQKLKAGDTITVSSLSMEYTYRVRSVSKENISDGAIPLSVSGRVLTLSTCNSFATKSDRFVVVADFVESHPYSS